MELVVTPYGPQALARLVAAVKAAKAGDPLAPVTVIVPHNYAGVSTRRFLGRSVVAGDHPGVAAVQFLTPYRLAELLGGPRLAAAGRRPVSTAVLAATVREALADDPGVFAAVREHPATERALVGAHRELSEVGHAGLERLAQQGTRAADVVRIHRAVWGRLHQSWYVETDLAAAAADAIADDPRLVDGFGPIIWFLPQRLAPSLGALGAALVTHTPCTAIAGLTGVALADTQVVSALQRLGIDGADAVAADADIEPPTQPWRVISASDADDEVRAVVRSVVEAARRGIPLDAMAVLHPARDPYSRLLHEQLAGANIPVNGTTPRTLAESLVGRTLLGMLDLPDHDYRRTDVMAWLASAPIRWRERLAPAAAWERASRAAGVVGGTEQWAERMKRYAAELRTRAVGAGDNDQQEWLLERLERDAARADSLAAFVAALARDIGRSSATSTWRKRSAWASGLVTRYLGLPDDGWPDIEHVAADKVQAALDRLAGLDAVETSPSAAVFRRTLLHELDTSLGRVGRLGSGVLVATPSDALGVHLEHVFLLGLAEGTFPTRVKDDSLLPDRERKVAGHALPQRADKPNDDYRQLLAVLSASAEATITWPRGDLRRSTERMPSRWLVDIVEAALGPVRGPGLQGADADWVTDISSHVGGLLGSSFPPSRHEFDLRSLLDNERDGGDLDGHDVVASNAGLGRAVELVRARRSADLTRFDGFIGERPGLDPSSGDQILSATRLETWVQCPLQYLMKYVLRVQPIDAVDDSMKISPLDKGSVIHEVLDQFFTEVIARPSDEQPSPGTDWTPTDHDRMTAIANQRLSDLEARGLTGRSVFWGPDRRAIVGELSQFLAKDNEYRAASRAVPIAAELGFGLPRSEAPPMEWVLPDGRLLRFRGSADRVDLLPGNGVAVLDYKTGSTRKYKGIDGEDPDKRGSVLQLPIYARAARAVLNRPDADVYAAYWFASAKFKFQQIGYDVTDDVMSRFDDVLTVVADGIAAGAFVAHPDEPGFHFFVSCDYCDPDGLGTRHRWVEWERKRHDPAAAAYLELVEPEVVT